MPDPLPLDPVLYARVGPLLDQALDLAPERRAQWLADLRDESPEVLQTLATLLEGDTTSRALLPSGPGRYSLEQLLGGWSPSLAGTAVGAWTLDALIGQGGMGTVWLAHRADGTFTGRAAIKLLHLSSVTPLALEQFRREGTLLATLSHANIARLLDAGVTETGQPFLVMEYVDGVPLDVYAREHRLSQTARVGLIQQVLDAISHAHAQLIVHRDLKPSNILVRPNGRVTLLDFGIGRQLLQSTDVALSAVTEAGGRALTPLYASPEQLRGEAIGTASDTYSAAVVAYQLLTGAHPTAGESRTAADIMRTTFETEPRPTALGDLDTILRKALKKAPIERYETAAAFNDDLRRYVERKPVRARPDTVGYRLRRFVQRNRVGVAGTAVAILAVMGTAGVAVRQAWQADLARSGALFQTERAEATRQLQTLLLSQIGTTALSQKQLLDKGVQMFDAGQTTDPRITISLLLNFADRYSELERNVEAGALLLRADSSARRLADVPAMFATACALSRHYVEMNKPELAQQQLARSEAVVAGTAKEKEVDRIACLLARASLFSSDAPHDSALTLYRRVVAILDSTGRGNTLQMVSVQSRIAGFLGDRDRSREAIAVLERQQEALTRLGLAGSFAYTGVRANIATAQGELGERAAVLPVWGDVNARLLAADTAGGINPTTGFNFAAELLADGQADSALVWYRAVVASAAKRKNAVVESRAQFGVVRCLATLGRGGEAASAITKYVSMMRALKRPVYRDSLILAASVAAAVTDTAGAVVLLEGVMTLDSVLVVPQTNRRSWTALRTLTPLLLSRGNAERARTYARVMRTIADTDSLTGTRSADVGLADLYIARAFAAQGQRDSARVWAAAAQTALRVGAGPRHATTREAEALLGTLR
ncbi:MAG: serine/threonine protein kinase [Gemmatimonadaceae bacterium]|nr:serine/threonine protein kinase [Gemmatimonadaceae bacterium]